ncbi:uncharacterized protein LOC134795715 isoform X3 [Cydia splendana]|uniref:uncharacterized protein LOC134795715 isoform X3 n=1 Tax=Cydia splendana TaxID=1100963 RepID=UPI00300DAADF
MEENPGAMANTTNTNETDAWRDWTLDWYFHPPLSIAKPGATIFVGTISIEDEWLYDIWIWYSCVYVPVMLVTMYVVLTGSVWALNIQPMRSVFATVAIIFYLFMFYCIVYVMSEKRKIFTTTTAPTQSPTSRCPACPECTTQKCTTPAAIKTQAQTEKAALRLIQYLSDRV